MLRVKKSLKRHVVLAVAPSREAAKTRVKVTTKEGGVREVIDPDTGVIIKQGIPEITEEQIGIIKATNEKLFNQFFEEVKTRKKREKQSDSE